MPPSRRQPKKQIGKRSAQQYVKELDRLHRNRPLVTVPGLGMVSDHRAVNAQLGKIERIIVALCRRPNKLPGGAGYRPFPESKRIFKSKSEYDGLLELYVAYKKHLQPDMHEHEIRELWKLEACGVPREDLILPEHLFGANRRVIRRRK